MISIAAIIPRTPGVLGTLSEFTVIEKYFSKPFSKSSLDRFSQSAHHQEESVVLGIGDDAAIINPFLDQRAMVVCVDTLVEGVHFLSACEPEDIAYKALAVNISDFAAMGATPKWMTLALTLPEVNDAWLSRFSSSLRVAADQYGILLVGGDTTQGPLTISIQLMGTKGHDTESMCRSAAKPGQLIGVTGVLGAAALGLEIASGTMDIEDPFALQRLNRPEPRLALGQILSSYAAACIDISDGLRGDLAHICRASNVNATIEVEDIPIYEGLIQRPTQLSREGRWHSALAQAISFGDDYELLFTIEPDQWPLLLAKLNALDAREVAYGSRVGFNEGMERLPSGFDGQSAPSVQIIGLIGSAHEQGNVIDHHEPPLIQWVKRGKPYHSLGHENSGYEHFK